MNAPRPHRMTDDLSAELAALRAENARLREALRMALKVIDAVIPAGAVYTLEEHGPSINLIESILKECKCYEHPWHNGVSTRARPEQCPIHAQARAALAAKGEA